MDGKHLNGDSRAEQIRKLLIRRSDLIPNKYRLIDHPLSGLCSLATEMFYFMFGKAEGWHPRFAKVSSTEVFRQVDKVQEQEIRHWWLEKQTGERIDITWDQFTKPFPYQLGRKQGFMPRGTAKGAIGPSKRAVELILELDPQFSIKKHDPNKPFLWEKFV